MPFQAIAWACKPYVETPLERCVLIWLAREASPQDEMVDRIDFAAMSRFCGASVSACQEAIASLHDRRLLIRTDREDSIFVCLPYGPLVQAADDDWVVLPNRAPIPDAVKAAVLKAYGGRCFACGSRDQLHVDHIIPRAKGGTNDPENLQALCGDCNIRKRDRTTWVTG